MQMVSNFRRSESCVNYFFRRRTEVSWRHFRTSAKGAMQIHAQISQITSKFSTQNLAISGEKYFHINFVAAAQEAKGSRGGGKLVFPLSPLCTFELCLSVSALDAQKEQVRAFSGKKFAPPRTVRVYLPPPQFLSKIPELCLDVQNDSVFTRRLDNRSSVNTTERQSAPHSSH